MKTYVQPQADLLQVDSLDILTVSLSGDDDGVVAPADWFIVESI